MSDVAQTATRLDCVEDQHGDDPQHVIFQCTCRKSQLQVPLSAIFGSLSCQCDACKQFSGSCAGVSEWLHIPHLDEAVCLSPLRDLLCRGERDPSSYVAVFAAENSSSQSNTTDAEQYRQLSHKARFFCRRCGSTLGVVHREFEGILLSQASLEAGKPLSAE